MGKERKYVHKMIKNENENVEPNRLWLSSFSTNIIYLNIMIFIWG